MSEKKNNTEKQIIIAYYSENLSWIIPYKELCFIYNKSEKPLNFINSYQIKNVGRESHTYLMHIINNWNNLAEITLFCQGRISDHNPYSIDYYLNYSSYRNKEMIINLNCHKTNCFRFWGHVLINLNKNSNFQWSKYNFGDWWNIYVKKPKPKEKEFCWSSGAIFSISKKLIYSNSLEYYKHLLSCLEYSSNPEEGHYFERSWYYIFNKGIL